MNFSNLWQAVWGGGVKPHPLNNFVLEIAARNPKQQTIGSQKTLHEEILRN